MDWIYLAPVKDKWQTPVNKVQKNRVPKNGGNFLTS